MINLPFIIADQNGPKHLVKSLSRADLERLVGDLIQRTLDPCKKALADAGVKAGGEVGDPDPVCAVRDALARGQFDEIIVSTLPERLSRWLHQDLPSRLEHKFHLPVTHVEAAQASSR